MRTFVGAILISLALLTCSLPASGVAVQSGPFYVVGQHYIVTRNGVWGQKACIGSSPSGFVYLKKGEIIKLVGYKSSPFSPSFFFFQKVDMDSCFVQVPQGGAAVFNLGAHIQPVQVVETEQASIDR